MWIDIICTMLVNSVKYKDPVIFCGGQRSSAANGSYFENFVTTIFQVEKLGYILYHMIIPNCQLEGHFLLQHQFFVLESLNLLQNHIPLGQVYDLML